MKTQICLAKLSGLVVPTTLRGDSKLLAATLNTEMMNLGFIMSEELFGVLSVTEPGTAQTLSVEVLKVLKKMKGADVKYKPMYPNFPKQVMEAASLELYFNAILHYWTLGEWKPEYVKELRELSDISTKLQSINLLEEEDFANFFGQLLTSNDSLSDGDKKIVEWYIDNYDSLQYPDVIPYKETMCIVAGKFMETGRGLAGLIHTATDVLRIATYLSDGDVSLAMNTKFKSLPRKYRRSLVIELDRVISEEDIKRHRNKWNKLFHSLHVCEYSDKKACSIATKVRGNKKLYSTLGDVEARLSNADFTGAAKILEKRPGEFARRLDHLLRDLPSEDALYIVDKFMSVAPKVSTRVLTQVLGHFGSRTKGSERVVFPKGSTTKAQIIEPTPGKISSASIKYLFDGIFSVLSNRFHDLGTLNTVWVDPLLKGCPLPAAQRSASEGLNTVARGTRLPMGDDNTLRMFIYWVGRDIDLSATLHNDKFDYVGHISYTNLREKAFEAYHSGDITMAHEGASEFIDITLDKLAKNDIRYIVMNVFVYAGPNFNEHEKCYAGWMTRSKPLSNEVYEPKTVKSKIDLVSASRNAIPVIFDVWTREAIWCDLVTRGVRGMRDRGNLYSGNNLESNFASIQQVLASITNLHNKFTLYNLFSLHAQSRGVLVENREDAETVFALEDGIGPYDINLINSDYLV